jgi:Flp pilus assembly protein TadD
VRKRISNPKSAHLRRLWPLPLLFYLLLSGCAATATKSDEQAESKDVQQQVQQAIAQGDKEFRKGDLERALFNYVTALNLDPDNVDALYRVGVLETENGNPEAAERAFAHVLAVNPDHAGALEGHGLVLLRQRKYAAAKRMLEQAVSIDASRWRADNGLGVIADIENDHALAASYYQLALEQRPDTPLVLNNLGYSYYLAGDWASAEEAFKRALAVDPKHAKAWSNLAMLHVRKGEYNQALNAFTKVMDKPEAYNSMGYICMLEGKFEQAESFLLKAVKLSPSYYEEAHENLARARARLAAESDIAVPNTTYGLQVQNPTPP